MVKPLLSNYIYDKNLSSTTKNEVHLRLTVNDCKLLSIQFLSLIQNYKEL